MNTFALIVGYIVIMIIVFGVFVTGALFTVDSFRFSTLRKKLHRYYHDLKQASDDLVLTSYTLEELYAFKEALDKAIQGLPRTGGPRKPYVYRDAVTLEISFRLSQCTK